MKRMKPVLLALALCTAVAVAASAQPAPATAPAAASVAFVALNVADLDKSLTFYKAAGFNVLMQVGNKPTRQAVLSMTPNGPGGGLILVEHNGPVEMGSAISRIGVRTPDIAGLCSRIADAGSPCTRPPHMNAQEQNTTVGFAKDPDGNALELLQLAK